MKQLYIVLFIMFCTTAANAQQGWTATGVATGTNNGVSGFIEHDGDLYAWTYQDLMRKSTDGGATWTTIPTTGIPAGHRVDVMESAGNRIYIGTYNPLDASGILAYSTDGGSTFVMDTVGLAYLTVGPGTGKLRSPRDLHFWGGHVLVSQKTADAYFIKALNDTVWTEDLFLKQVESDAYVSSGDTLFATADGGFYYTTDFGTNWVTPTNTNMPSVYDVSDMVYSDGVFYISGANVFITERDLYKSSDLGETWERTNAYTYLRNNFIGQPQATQQLYAGNGKLFLSLQNDAGNTTVDILVSDDDGDTFVLDTMGLPNDQFATGTVLKFTESNGILFAVVSSQDTYQQTIGGGSSGTTPTAPTNLTATSTPKQMSSDVTLTWDDNSNNETGFLIERSEDNSTWATAGTVAANIATYTDAGQSEGTLYYYRVSATNANGSSAFSNIVTITTGVTGINEQLSASINLYPNPSNGVTILSGLGSLEGTVTVTNVLGETVQHIELTQANTVALNLTDAGLYIIYIETNAGAVVRRLMIE